MIAKTYTAGTDLPIYNARCGLRETLASNLLNRWDLVYVDVRHRTGTVDFDTDGYLPHLQYTPQYAATEEDRGEWILTGNQPTPPVFRFDPAPFFATVGGSIVLTGGAGTAVYDVTVLLKRFTRAVPLRHTLTVGTNGTRLERPFGASGIYIPSSTNATNLLLGNVTRNVDTPNGSFVACGPFDVLLFATDNVVTFEVVPPW